MNKRLENVCSINKREHRPVGFLDVPRGRWISIMSTFLMGIGWKKVGESGESGPRAVSTPTAREPDWICMYDP